VRLTDWLLVEVALLLIGLNKISLTKYGFNHPFVTELPLWLRALIRDMGRFQLIFSSFRFRLHKINSLNLEEKIKTTPARVFSQKTSCLNRVSSKKADSDVSEQGLE
jgi:hypothetical protein